MALGEIIKNIETSANLDLSVFREPRGVCRVLQLVIGTLAGIAIYGFGGVVTVNYCKTKTAKFFYSYPFQLSSDVEVLECLDQPSYAVKLASGDPFSTYAECFFLICMLSILYCFVVIVIYSKCTQSYETNNRYPLYDFIGTVAIAVLWLFASAAWAHNLTALKDVTDVKNVLAKLEDERPKFLFESVTNNGYFGLNVSAILGCLCFFLWASDLWFLYKETPWFQGRRGQAVDSPA